MCDLQLLDELVDKVSRGFMKEDFNRIVGWSGFQTGTAAGD